jgi:nucleoside-diphosphate-sugar epimerase
MEDVFNLIKEIMQNEATFESSTERLRPEKSEVFRLWCDNTKLIEMTGFKPSHTIRAGLEKTIAWYTKKENLTKFKADIYNV